MSVRFWAESVPEECDPCGIVHEEIEICADNKKPTDSAVGTIGSIDSLCRKKDLRTGCASGPNCRHSLDNGGWFRGDWIHFRKFHEQFFNLALLMRLGQAGLFHSAILSRREKNNRHSCTPCEAPSVQIL